MKLNFLLMEMTHLRYWMPLVLEGNKRGIKSEFYIHPSHKYNCPLKYKNVLSEIEKDHNVAMKPIKDIFTANGILFSNEKTGIDIVSKTDNLKKVVCTYQTDFIESYKAYVDKVDHVLMPSRNIAEYYDRHTEKNLYLGIPKYDISFDKQDVINKYSLEGEKFVTIVSPKARDQGKVKMPNLMSYLEFLGYTILLKSRGKDPIDKSYKDVLTSQGHYYFHDNSWYPHTTQELLSISDLVVNFGSTTVEECVMQDVPLINFDVKPKFRNGSERPYRITHEYLYKYNYCVQMNNE